MLMTHTLRALNHDLRVEEERMGCVFGGQAWSVDAFGIIVVSCLWSGWNE